MAEEEERKYEEEKKDGKGGSALSPDGCKTQPLPLSDHHHRQPQLRNTDENTVEKYSKKMKFIIIHLILK